VHLSCRLALQMHLARWRLLILCACPASERAMTIRALVLTLCQTIYIHLHSARTGMPTVSNANTQNSASHLLSLSLSLSLLHTHTHPHRTLDAQRKLFALHLLSTSDGYRDDTWATASARELDALPSELLSLQDWDNLRVCHPLTVSCNLGVLVCWYT
jgi:hypothetical protein